MVAAGCKTGNEKSIIQMILLNEGILDRDKTLLGSIV
jgi:hypothetical protein